jgi:hypothetical protein
MAIKLNTVVSKNPQIISSKMDDEVVMMSVEKGNYYGLNRVGSEIWEKLTEPVTVAGLCDKLTQEFNVEKEQCEREVITYLDKLVSEGLILVCDKPEN